MSKGDDVLASDDVQAWLSLSDFDRERTRMSINTMESGNGLHPIATRALKALESSRGAPEEDRALIAAAPEMEALLRDLIAADNTEGRDARDYAVGECIKRAEVFLRDRIDLARKADGT